MSWFDATGFANLAKSALKEAQKTIDKALDIKDEEVDINKQKAIHVEDSDFFATWGLKGDGESGIQEKVTSKQQPSSSIWGSFTGSFFETPKVGDNDVSRTFTTQSKSLVSTPVEKSGKHKLISSTSLPEDLSNPESSQLKLTDDTRQAEMCKELRSQHTSPAPVDCMTSTSSSCENVTESPRTSEQSPIESTAIISDMPEGQRRSVRSDSHDSSKDNITDDTDSASCTDDDRRGSGNSSGLDIEKRDANMRQLCASYTLNRVSVISSESDKKSLESVEVLGSQSNTDCSTTPESDINSVSNSISPSAAGAKVTSESVEVLPDSLVTSPSSVEILGDWKSDSPFLSPMESKLSDSSPMFEGDESVTPCGESNKNFETKSTEDQQDHPSSSDVSPYESPMEEIKTLNTNSCPESIDSTPSPGTSSSMYTNKKFSSADNSKSSPESVEVIRDVDELDEVSLAEDSYTSASESTVMTIMETFQQFDQSKPKLDFPDINKKMHDSCPDGRQASSKSVPDTQLNLSLDSLKEKHNLHLPLQPITTQPIRKPECLESVNKKTEHAFSQQLINTTIEPPDPESVAENEQAQKVADTLEGADQYLMLTDSSCEGTLIESSSEDNATLMCASESKVIETPLTASSYVKTMLADAMVEKGEVADVETESVDVPRESSPISSESRSDLVKIGSDQTSGHTSGDELETTTSSDIEIISSPNGDSSSTQSRQSPAKLQLSKGSDLLTKTLKTRGHSRELSEISIGSDDTNLEIEKLLRRVQEITEILEARESKLIDVSRMNMELHEQNNTLKKQLDHFEKHAEQNQNLNQITDEYTQRLSALERKFQQAIRERDSLRKTLEQLKQEAATRLSSQEISSINAEKDEIIKELREEGEKLSKQQLQHSNIIKKLRTKEKESDAMIKNQKEQIEEQSSELERLKRSLHAKEEVERTQIEAVHTLTAKTKKQEKEILSLQEQLDNALHKIEAYKRSLDVAKVDLAETKQNLVATEEELKHAVESAGESCQLFAQVEDLKIKLRQAEEAHVKKEQFLKQENTELLKRLEAAEARSEELAESVSVATMPLLRQLEQLQASMIHKTNNYMKQEKILSEKNIELQTKLDGLIEMDRCLKEENISSKMKLSQLESKLNSKEAERSRLEELYEKLSQKHEELNEENLRHKQIIDTMEQTHCNEIKDLKREINSLENKLAIEKAATDAEKRKNNAILEQQQSIEDEVRLSPTLSIGRDSVSSANSVWPAFNDSVFESSSGRFPIMYDGIRAGSSSTTTLEHLQAQLKQRDGEIQQLQWEISRRNAERDALNSELSTLTLKVEELSNQVSQVQELSDSLNEIQTRYDALLQMYGEKVEENQELLLDLEDVKDMYKSQIDQLLKRDN